MTSAAAKGLADSESCQMTSRGRLISQLLIIHKDFLAASTAGPTSRGRTTAPPPALPQQSSLRPGAGQAGDRGRVSGGACGCCSCRRAAPCADASGDGSPPAAKQRLLGKSAPLWVDEAGVRATPLFNQGELYP